jgi:hypothetical protein
VSELPQLKEKDQTSRLFCTIFFDLFSFASQKSPMSPFIIFMRPRATRFLFLCVFKHSSLFLLSVVVDDASAPMTAEIPAPNTHMFLSFVYRWSL